MTSLDKMRSRLIEIRILTLPGRTYHLLHVHCFCQTFLLWRYLKTRQVARQCNAMLAAWKGTLLNGSEIHSGVGPGCRCGAGSIAFAAAASCLKQSTVNGLRCGGRYRLGEVYIRQDS